MMTASPGLARCAAAHLERHNTDVRIALFATCLADPLFPAVAGTAVRVLERLGHPVEFPAGQTRCGQVQGKGAGT